MVENINGSIVIDGDQKRPKEHVIIQQSVASATSSFKDSENYIYENIARLSRVQAVLDATLGSSGQNQASDAYDRMNFDNDSYLNRIGMGSGGQHQKQLDEYMSHCSFESVSTPHLQGFDQNENGISIHSSGFSSEELSKIQSSGKFEYQGISYGATVDANNNIQLTSSYGNMFQQAESSKLTIDLDPTKGINTLHTSISTACLSKEEQSSIGETGSFSRGGVTYNASPVNSSVVNISASFKEGSSESHAIYAQNRVHFSQINYQMNGSALNQNQISNAVQNNGTYDLGGMKFSAVPTPFTTKDASGNPVQSVSQFNSSTAQRLLNNANNEYANNRARLDVRGKEDKASVIYDIQKRGQNYICNQSSYLKGNFNGRNAKSCISHIDREISSLRSSKVAGWESKVAALTDQKNLLIEYDKHGGCIQNPTKSKSTMGRDIIMGQVLGSDMMRGINYYRTGIRTAKTAYRAATGLTTNALYLGSKFSNSIVQKSLSAVAGKDYVGVEKLKAIQKGTDKLYFTRKDRIRAKKEGRYKEYKRDRKNQRFTAKGDRLENKRAKLDKKLTETISDKNKLLGNGGIDTKDYKKLRAKEDRLKRRIDRNDKKKRVFALDSAARKKNAGPSRIQVLRSKFKNSGFGKLLSKISNIFSFPKRLLAKLKAFLASALISLIAGYLHFVVKFGTLILCVFLIVLFVSNLPVALPNDLEQRVLHSENYQQMIVNITEQDIAQDLQIVCEVDATNHYLSKQHVKHERYPWYYAAKMGEISHVWVWEESDNTTRYANEGDEIEYDDHALPTGLTGDLVYANESLPRGENGNTYVSQPMRTELSDIEANMVPIVTMGHLRYYDDLDFNRWPTVLGYTYYMFAISHDISRYDTEAQYNHFLYGDTEKDPGYDYRIENFCDIPEGPLYAGEGIQWDPESHTLSRDEEICQNIYIHDFPAEDYECGITSVKLEHYSKVSDNPVTKTIRSISSYAQKFIGKLTGNKDEKADTFDKGYTDSNDILTLNLRKASLKGIKNRELTDLSISMTIEQLASKYNWVVDIDKNASGIFMFDGNPESLPHAQSHEGVGGRDLNGIGEACDKVLYFPYGVTSDSGAEEGDSDEARLIPGEDLGAKDDCHDHSWTKGCFTLICGEEEREGKWVDGDGNETIAEAYGAQYEAGHTHSIGCYDLTSFECAHGKAYSGTGGHEPWESETSPGCWKTVSICGGHCGGHITPLINIVQKMTYEGLAQDDNFKTTYWLQAEEVTNSGGYSEGGIFGLLDKAVEDNIVTVGQFRSYWMAKCNTWFSPLPRSPYGFAKTICKQAITDFCKAWDGITTGINFILKTISGGTLGNYESSDDTEDNDWLAKTTEDGDMWQWDGWWNDNDTIDISLITEMESYTGTYKDNEFESGKLNWADFDVQFGSMGLSSPIYTPEEIEAIINQIAASYDFSGMELTAKQRAILEAALSRCGTFSYSLSGSAHNNAINNDKGRGDCSGWVTGTLLKALGINYNTNAAGYANKGVYNGVKKPGSIIAHKNGGAGYSGHVMIYAGYLSDGPDGPGHYVMDCSSSKGGSSFRRVSQTTLDRYKYVWNP